MIAKWDVCTKYWLEEEVSCDQDVNADGNIRIDGILWGDISGDSV